MSILPGIYASQITGHLSINSYDSIQTVTLGASQTTVTFSSIPQTYKHLQIRGIARSTRAVSVEGAWAYFNNDTSTTTYVVHGLAGDGSSASSYNVVPTSGGVQAGLIAAASAGSNMFGGFVCDILDYTNTSKNKVTRSLTGTDINGSGGTMRLVSGLWLNTAAITSIKFDTQGGGDFTQYSSFALYGIK